MTHDRFHDRFSAGFELKFLAATGVFEGYASVFHVVDHVGDRIAPGAFKESLAEWRGKGRFPPLLWQHEAMEPIGAWREMYEDAHGLYVRGDLFINDIPLAKEAHKLLKENVVSGLSIGYRARESHREQKNGIRVLTKVDLLEVSLVTFPANEHARVLDVKRAPAALPTERELEGVLREAGLSRRLAKSVIAQGYKALAVEEPAEDEEAFMQRFIHEVDAATAVIQHKNACVHLTRALRDATGDVLTGRAVYPREFVANVGLLVKDIATKYSPDQPRDDHGRWSGGGAQGDVGTTTAETTISRSLPSQNSVLAAQAYANAGKLQVNDAVQNLKENIIPPYGNHQCAHNVTDALSAGGINIVRPSSRYAKDYGLSLQDAGFSSVASVSSGAGYPPKGYTPEVGDVTIIQPTSDPKHPEGHMMMYTGTGGWYSDFKQKTFWPGQSYRDQKPSYVIYRHSIIVD